MLDTLSIYIIFEDNLFILLLEIVFKSTRDSITLLSWVESFNLLREVSSTNFRTIFSLLAMRIKRCII